MGNLMNFLTSKEAIIIYAVAVGACALCFIIYIVEKSNEKLRKRHNTKELNKLVEQIKEEVPEVKRDEVIYDKPILSNIQDVESVDSLLEKTIQMNKVNEEVSSAQVEVLETTVDSEKVEEPIITEEMKEELIVIEKNDDHEEELQYTSIEPDQETARLELQRITEELKKQEALVDTEPVINNYEIEQEENAIISLDELLKKGKEMYESNEATQYADDGNEPISLEELDLCDNDEYNKPFIIENVVPKEETVESEVIEAPLSIEVLEEMDKKVNVRLDNNNVIQTEVKNEARKFKSSPIISPIYGIESKSESVNDLALENTANYDKLDQEIKKTNEFIMSLKELQGKLD